MNSPVDPLDLLNFGVDTTLGQRFLVSAGRIARLSVQLPKRILGGVLGAGMGL